MSKAGKRGKSGDVKGGPAGGGKWDHVLSSCAFEEESWNPCVTWIVGRQPEDSKHIEALNIIVQTGTRKLFSVVTKAQLYLDVLELGNPKNKKAKEIPANSEVCEACKPYIDAGEPIPVPLLAKLIKWKLMAIKTADLKRRDMEAKGVSSIASVEKAKAASDKKKAAGKDGKEGGKERAKSPKKGGKKTPEPQAAKEGSKLKKRGEEDSDNKCIDDEPEDGAHHYILVTGFRDPRLFQYLEEIGVNVSSVIRVTSQDYERLRKPVVEGENNAPAEPTEADLKEEIIAKEQSMFWKDLLPLLQRLPDSSRLHNIARLDYEVKSLMIPVDPNEAEQKVQYSTALFEDIAVMIYDLLDARRLYKTYLENLKLVNVPVYGQEEITDASPVPPPTPGVAAAAPAHDTGAAAVATTEKPQAPPVDMRFYNDLMNTVPLESASVPLIMHCMLEQVVATEEGTDPPSEQAPPARSDGLHFSLASYLTEVAFKLGLSEKEHQILSEVLDLPDPPPEEPSPPELINIQDDISIRTQHLKPHHGFDPAAVERMMLKLLPFAKLCHIQRPSSAESRQRGARLQELMHYCATDGLSRSEIDRAFKQFVFECMDLATTDPNGFILEKEKEGLQHTAIPWDDPYPYFKVMIPSAERPVSTKLSMSTPSDERSEDDPRKYRQHLLESEENLAFRGSRGMASDVILEVLVNLGNGACTPDQGDSGKGRSSRPGSGESKKGILISSRLSGGSISPKRSRSNSVHWDVPLGQEESDRDILGTNNLEAKTMDESHMEVVDAQQRNMDQWCFAEHFKPHILLQILQEASYNLPFVETYHHKRDQTMMLVLHNPYSSELHNHVDWHEELHSNVGFRNYLDYTAESIAEWLKEKEAEYQAVLLSKEVESIQKEEEDKAKAAEKVEKTKKSPRKSPSRSKSPRGSRTSSQERPGSSSSNPYVRQGSLKAFQAEQDKLAQEEEEKERAKLEKRTKSAQKLREKEEKEKADKAKSPRGSAKSRQSKTGDLDVQSAPQPHPDTAESREGSQAEEKFWPFSGYNTGNQLIHLSGITTTLFPSDGGRIKTERTEFVQGTTAIRSVVQKDEHVFSIHILNPREDMDLPEDYEAQLENAQNTNDNRDELSTAEKSETEAQEKDETEKDDAKEKDGKEPEVKERRPAVSQFGSVTAQLSDGMVLALSQFGASGESYLKPYEPALYVPPPHTETPSLPQAAVSPSKNKKDSKKEKSTPEPEKLPADDDVVEEEKKDEEKPIPKQDFQELFVTCPDGLTVRYFLQSSVGVTPNSADERQLAVKQSYPFKTKGVQDCESTRQKYIQSEVSRVITAEGNVVKNMVDGTVEVLSADGTVSVFSGQWPTHQSRASSPARSVKSAGGGEHGRETPTKKGSGKKMSRRQITMDADADEEVKLTPSAATWVITYPSGERMQVSKDTGDCNELSSVPICVATDPDTQQTMATRDDHVITVSYPDGTTVVEHADGTRITVYYRETAVTMEETDDDSNPEVSMQTLKFVKVECPAFATVEFNTSTSENLTVFGSGTSINVFPDGYYILHHNRGGRVEVDTEGTMVYFPRRSRFLEHLMPERELQYVLRHNADVIVETVDPEGNVFNVRSTGDFNVIPVRGDEAMSDDSDEQNDEKEKKITYYNQHAPRFFIVHADGSGTELLRYQDVAEYLMLSEQNPATAVLKDSLSEHPGVTGITVLKPYLSGLSEKWLKRYDQESIVPQGIRCRDLKSLPNQEYKKPGPKFGTNVGKGLSVGAASKGPVRIPILKCPHKLELRQLVQYKPMSEQLRNKLQAGLCEYAEAVVSRMRTDSLMGIDDPRSEDEKILAQDLKSLADSQKPETKECEPEHVKSVYEKAVAPAPPSPPATPQPKRTLADWERDRRELLEEEEAKKKLANKTIEPYFDSELGKAFLLTQASDMDEMMRQLAEDPRQDASAAVRGGNVSHMTYTQSPALTQNVPPSQPGASVLSDRSTTSDSPATNNHMKNGQDTPLSYTAGMSEAATVTPTGGVRPHNPTPAHATGQGSPAPLRPKNPTPAHAGKVQTDRPGNPTPKIALGVETPSEYEPSIARGEYPMILEYPWEEEDTEMHSAEPGLNHVKSLTTNVIGEPRSESITLPLSIKGGRPGAQPNVRFIETEEPVRRHVRNSLVAGATAKGQQQLNQMRGLICQPEGVNFGVLKEGCTYAYTVALRNTGVDTCRFKVRQPPPATGLRVVYKPGPVAAGMSVDLSLELYAIANGVEGESGVGSLGHVLEIVTETDILEMPIVATILTAHEYDNPDLAANSLRETSARLISTRPPASSGIIRPRRDQRMSIPS